MWVGEAETARWEAIRHEDQDGSERHGALTQL